MSLAAPPDVIRWTTRSGDVGDCMVVALEIACGVSYEEALGACLETAPRVLRKGMYWSQAKRAAKKLGFATKLIPFGRYDLNEDTGILYGTDGKEDHVVYLWEGRIVEPMARRRQLWSDPEQFLKYYNYSISSLLVIKDKT